MQYQPFPNKDTIVVKPKFEARYKALLGEERYKEFLDVSLSFQRRAIRVNTLKISVEELQKRLSDSWNLTPVPWCKESFWIEHKSEVKRRDIGNLVEHSLGYFYVQDPASAIPPVVLDPKPGDVVLDMCAAPGSKTTQLAQMMQNKGILIANEYVGLRIAALGINVQRMGVSNTLIHRCDANRISKKVQCDKILLDGPCSGTGTIRKSPKTLLMWNPNMIKRLGKTQLYLLENAYKHLKPGGIIVYSTCTLEPQENEGVISAFLQKHADMKTLDITIPLRRSNPVLSFEGIEYHPGVEKSLRIYPQDNDTEGFFICKLQKDSV